MPSLSFSEANRQASMSHQSPKHLQEAQKDREKDAADKARLKADAQDPAFGDFHGCARWLGLGSRMAPGRSRILGS